MINKKYENVIIFVILITLLSVVFSLSVLKDSKYLLIFYFISFFIQCMSFIILIRGKKLTINKKSFSLLVIYSLILFIPIISDAILNIKTNIYDYISVFIKIINFIIMFCCFEKLYLSKQQINKIFKYLIILGLVSCIYNYLFCFKDVLKLFTASSSYQVDIRSFFHNRNMFGEYMFISILSTLYFFEGKKSKIKVILLLLFSITAFITFSRTSIVSIVLLFMYLYLYKYGKKKINIFILVFLVIIVFAILLGPAKDYLNIYVVRSDNFTTGRTDIWETGFHIIKINPLFGIGNYTALDIAKNMGFEHSQFHSFFIETILGCGIFGLVFYMSLLYNILKKAINKLNGKNNYYKQCIIISFVVLFIKMFVESISFFSIGYSDLITSFFYVSLPLLLINCFDKEGDVCD